VSTSSESEQAAMLDSLTSADSGRAGLSAAIVTTMTQPLLVLDDRLRIELANPAFLERFEMTLEATVGRQLHELGNGSWNLPELRRLLEEVLSRERAVTDYRVELEWERTGRKIMLVNGNRIAQDRGPDRILLAITDITERERLLFDLEGCREFAEKLIDSVREGLVVLTWDLRVRTANHAFYRTFAVDPDETEGRLIYELGNGQWDIPRLRPLLQDILPNENEFDDFEVEHDFEQIGRRTMLLNARRLDHEHLILLVIRDVTAERRADVQREALTGELQHRVKNILNNVRALASQTRQRSSTLAAFAGAFDARLQALARAQNLLLRGPLKRIALGELVRFELEAWGAREGSTFSLRGPVLRLPPRDAQAMAMTIHELTTNALKHGALSVASGRVEVVWGIERQDAGWQFRLRWREHGVEVARPDPDKGFGSRQIEQSLPYMLGGSSHLSFHPDGAECVIELPLPEAWDSRAAPGFRGRAG
jgi:PAS domain S-box-containing protein